jgi:hypothetical protein
VFEFVLLVCAILVGLEARELLVEESLVLLCETAAARESSASANSATADRIISVRVVLTWLPTSRTPSMAIPRVGHREGRQQLDGEERVGVAARRFELSGDDSFAKSTRKYLDSLLSRTAEVRASAGAGCRNPRHRFHSVGG